MKELQMYITRIVCLGIKIVLKIICINQLHVVAKPLVLSFVCCTQQGFYKLLFFML